MKYKIVFLDVDGTLLDFEKAEKDIMKEPPRNPKEPLFDKSLFSSIHP